VLRIAGVNISMKKPLEISLTDVYGIGYATAKEICGKAGISHQTLPSQLSEEQAAILRAIVEKDYIVEGDLRRVKDRAIKRLISIRCYRGIRHQNKLPVRGQRSRTNARTRKKGIN
jgi:small subunit ribosomal protein S13